MAYILIADADELVAELASQTLVECGHACGWVTDVSQAWDLLHTGRRPDLFLLDQEMPSMSGVTLLKKLRGSPIHCDLPVIMFTATYGIEIETQAIDQGARGFVRKPFSPEVLVGSVDRVLAACNGRAQRTNLRPALAEDSGHARAARMLARKVN